MDFILDSNTQHHETSIILLFYCFILLLFYCLLYVLISSLFLFISLYFRYKILIKKMNGIPSIRRTATGTTPDGLAMEMGRSSKVNTRERITPQDIREWYIHKVPNVNINMEEALSEESEKSEESRIESLSYISYISYIKQIRDAVDEARVVLDKWNVDLSTFPSLFRDTFPLTLRGDENLLQAHESFLKDIKDDTQHA